MATFTAKTIADGQMATSETNMYLVPAATKGYVKQVTIYNTNAAQQTISIFIKRSGGTSRQIRRFVLDQYESVDLVDDGDTLELSTGDAIRGLTTTATAVDYVVMGVEET